ncbi:MAG: VOC family protein [Pseudomonadales bacterium]|nr:VOC family protein [Pseudomonadales bacterium]MCP5182533.1 VOC family protein [Pseudomonadales bacterium]
MKLRQIALAAAHLEPIRTNLMTLLGLDADFADSGVGEFGLMNTVQAIGDSFLEVVAPSRADTAAGRTLALRGEDPCGYMVLLQVADFAAFEARLDARGLRKVWRIDRPEVSAAHVHPKDIGGAIVSFDEMRPPAEWLWGGPGWQQRRARNAIAIVGCIVGARQPESMRARWADVLGVSAGDTRLNLDAGTWIDFVPAGKDGVIAAVLACDDPAGMAARARTLELDGVLRFVAAPAAS